MPIIYGLVGAPSNNSAADGSNQPMLQGKAGEVIASELRGKFFTGNYRGRLFGAGVTAQTIPVVTTTMVSVFTLYNPPGSGINMEMVETTLGASLATTVVNTYGWYYTLPAATAAGTFTTKGTAQSGLAGSGLTGIGQFFSAYTAATGVTPTRCDVIGATGGVVNATATIITKVYDGRLIIPPGIAMSIAGQIAAGPATGTDIWASWLEWAV